MKNVRNLDVPQRIHLPDGTTTWIQSAGKVKLYDSLHLKKVLLAPSFTHNLISVAQLISDMNVRCTFFDTHCLIQKREVIISLAWERL